MQVLVIGGSGRTGKLVLNELLKRGTDVSSLEPIDLADPDQTIGSPSWSEIHRRLRGARISGS